MHHQGREHAKGKYHDFLMKCEQAEAKGEERLLKVIMETALQGNKVVEVTERLDVKNGKVLERRTTRRTDHSDCRSAMFMLEKRYPERYGRQQKLEHVMPSGGGLVVQWR